jgi:hypothetical protein
VLKLPDARLHLVYDEADGVKTAELLNRLGDPASGRVVVDVTPAGRNLDWLAVDIERGLGKNPHLSGAGRNTSDRWSRIHAWLIGGQIKTLVVSRIQLLNEQRLNAAITLAIACGVDLWLVAQQKPLSTELAKTLEEWPLDEVALADFCRRWRTRRPPQTKTVEAKGGVDFPNVPLDEFVLFRARCGELLAPEDFTRVDSTFQATAASVIQWIDAARVIDEESVVALVRDLIGPCRTLPEAVTRLRAAQVAFFWRRYLLKVNLDYVLAAYAIEPRDDLDSAVIEKLSAYGAARYPAAAAIALGAQMSPADVALLDLDAVSVCPAGIALAGHGTLPTEAAALVLPHLVERFLDGASTADPLFVMHSTDKSKRDQRISHRGIERLLVQILRETGVRITASRSYTGLRGKGDNWRWREGISLQRIETALEAA